MKRTYFRILAVAAVGAMCSCSDFLDPYPSAIRSEDYILTNPTTMQGLVGKCYDYMAQNYNDNEGAYLDCATDNAVRTSTTDVLRRFAIGVTSPRTTRSKPTGTATTRASIMSTCSSRTTAG